MNLSQKHINEVTALKRCYPFRIIWAAITNDGEEIQGADYNRRQINKMARLGYKVFIVQQHTNRRERHENQDNGTD